MPLSEAEFYGAGPLPPEERKHVALRLLECVDGDTAVDAVMENWLRTEVADIYDALTADPSRGVPLEEVRADLQSTWASLREG